jgi:hypothetical protein
VLEGYFHVAVIDVPSAETIAFLNALQLAIVVMVVVF